MFPNNIFNFAYFTFKFWIAHIYNISKMVTVFIFSIELNCIYQTQSCIVGLEFESNINHITVDVRSSPLIPTPLPRPSLPQLPLKYIQPPRKQPLPSCEGCGRKNQRPSKRRTNPTPAAPPLSRGMWAAHSRRSMEGLGRESHNRGPMMWEAHLVRHEPIYHGFIFALPPLLVPY